MKQRLILLAAGICMAIGLSAQADTETDDTNAKKSKDKNSSEKQPRNLFKMNLPGIALKTYSFQYERVLTKRISLALGYGTMPKGPVPLKSTLLKALADEDPELKEILEKLQTSNYTITPELRFYLGKKGYGRGFYLAPYYRYGSFTVSDFVVNYENNMGVKNSINLSGKLTSNTGGILIGAQASLGKHIGLDFWILGAHYGKAKGNFDGVSNKPLTADEQQDLRDEINSLDIGELKATVNANGATLLYDNGPWGGLRAGLCLVFKF
ncbi:MAG: DUF3575 domain-containing protein [Bacteroidota bacterium]